MFKNVLLLMLFVMTSSAFASSIQLEDFSDKGLFGGGRRGCQGINMTSEQRTQIKEKMVAVRAATTAAKPELKAAKKALRVVMLDVDSVRTDAEEARANVEAIAHPLKKLRRDARLAIMFEILLGEQRVKLTKCRKYRRGRRGNRRDRNRRRHRRHYHSI